MRQILRMNGQDFIVLQTKSGYFLKFMVGDVSEKKKGHSESGESGCKSRTAWKMPMSLRRETRRKFPIKRKRSL